MEFNGQSNLPLHDHDLLIRLDENVKSIGGDVRSIKDESSRRLTEIEIEWRKQFTDFVDQFKTHAKEDAVHFGRIDGIIKIGVGVLATLQILVPLILKYFLKI